MKAATPMSRAPRPPSGQQAVRSSSRAASEAMSGISEAQLRRRLQQAEMQLRDLEEESRRVTLQQQRELGTMEAEKMRLSAALEQLRMEECMTPAELQAIAVAAGSARHAPSRLLGSSCATYKQTKERVDSKRHECAVAEEELEEARQVLAGLRSRRRNTSGNMLNRKAEAAASIAAAEHFKQQVRGQLRGLEEQVAREQERFSSMVKTAQDVRSEIDAMLITESRHEVHYRKQLDAILEKKKEMGFIAEVCNILAEERTDSSAALEEQRSEAAKESDLYEKAFEELEGVLRENTKHHETLLQKREELHRLLEETRHERMQLESQNDAAHRQIEQQRRAKGGRLGEAASDHNESSSNPLGRGTAGLVNDTLEGGSQGPPPTSGAMYERYLETLADIVQSDEVADVVNFLPVAAEERYRYYDEINHLQKEIDAMRAERLQLLATRQQGADSSPEESARANRLREKQLVLDAMQDRIDDQKTALHEGEVVTARVVEQLDQVFTHLGCSEEDLRKVSGAATVQRASLLPALALIEQRAEEYLLAYARSQQQQVTCHDGAEAPRSPPANPARTLLRRPDLPPAASAGDADGVAARRDTTRPAMLPRTTDAALLSHVPSDGPSPQQSATGAAQSNLEEIVGERPLTDEELKRVVEAKRLLIRS